MARTALREDEERAWQAFLHAHHDVMGRLDQELREEHGLSLGDYDVLVRLARAPDRRLRMSDLANRVMLSPSGLTRAVDRLARRGLVERAGFDGDARVTMARLSEQGLALVRRAAGTHLRGIRSHFTGRLAAEQLRNVADALEVVAGPHEPH